MFFKALSNIQANTFVDLRQAYESWHEIDQRVTQSYSGSQFWRTVDGKEYLKYQIGRIEKSIGLRSPETEKIYGDFITGREVAQSRLENLAQNKAVQSAIARSVGLGRVDTLVARILQALDKSKALGQIRVVGTNALFAYESLAGVHFSGDALATQDIDLLLDNRSQLELITDGRSRVTLIGLLQSIDHSFEISKKGTYFAKNQHGFMVDLIQPMGRIPWGKKKKGQPEASENLRASDIEGLTWLVNSPSISTIVIDISGNPAPIVAPDPRVWLLHKAWVSERPNREIAKKRRDLAQAQAVFQLLTEYLPQYPMDDAYLQTVPKVLRELLPLAQQSARL